MSKLSNDNIEEQINKDLVQNFKDINSLKIDYDKSCAEAGLNYVPVLEWVPVDIVPENIEINELIKIMGIDHIDDKWEKADWIAVFIAGGIGIILDVLITQTSILRPIDLKVKDVLKNNSMTSFKDALNVFSNSLRDGKSAPIDFQGFSMHGNKSIHEVYSFGHDPLRFIEGIIQFMTGDYRGIDKLGSNVSTNFGERIPSLIQATISYVAHMISDLLNSNSLPYPGSTFLMQFGSEETRKQIASAYRSQLYNSRIAIYQGLPSLFISIVIHCWAAYDCYVHTNKVNLLIGSNPKYQSMLLVANAMVATSNITINSMTAFFGDSRALIRINWPVITNTLRLALQYRVNDFRRDNENKVKVDELYNEVTKEEIEHYTIDEYVKLYEKQFNDFLTREG